MAEAPLAIETPSGTDLSEAHDASDAFVHRRGVFATIQHVLHRFPVVSPAAVLALAFIVFGFFNNLECGVQTCGQSFRSGATIGQMFQSTAVMAALAVGQTLIILTAGVDLSIGASMVLIHLFVAKVFAEQGVNGFVALGLGALAGMTLGLFHGVLVTKIGLPPFIVTLGTFYMYQSVGLVYSKAQTTTGEDIGGENGLLLFTGRIFKFFSIPLTYGVVVVIILYAILAYVLANTAWGKHVYATGNDKEAARLAGIDVTRVLISVYVVAGLIYAVGAWVQLGRSGSASANAAVDVNLESITAVVIGGTSVFGGRGRIIGTLIGAAIVAVLDKGLSLFKVDPYLKNFAIGALILVAVGLDQWIRKVGK
jgi:fructose transport system permease protein